MEIITYDNWSTQIHLLSTPCTVIFVGVFSYFDRFGETKTEVVILILVALSLNFGFGILIPFMPIYAENLGASITMIGVIVAAFTAGRAVAANYAGDYSDRIGRKRVMTFGTALYGIATGLMAFVPSWQSLFFLRIVEGASVGIVQPTAQAYIVDVVPKDKVGEASGLYSTTFSVGFFIGPILGSVSYWTSQQFGLSDANALRSIFLVTAFFAFVGYLIVQMRIEDFDPEYYENIQKELDKLTPQKEEINAVKPDLNSEYNKYYFTSFLMGVGIGFIIPIFTLYYIDVFGATATLAGIIVGVSGGINAVISVPAGYWGDRYGRKGIMLFAFPIMVLATAILGLAPTIYVAVILLFLRSIGQSMFIPNFRGLQADVVLAKERGKVFGRTQTAFNFGAVMGPIVGAYLYDIMKGRVFEIAGFKFVGEGVPFVLTAIFQFSLLYFVLKFYYPVRSSLTVTSTVGIPVFAE